METIYISGPIKDIYNAKELFYSAQSKLTNEGYKVINPFEIINDNGTFVSGSNKELYEFYLRMDIRELTFCDSIYILKGWEKSNGANIELNVAKAIGLKIYYE
jgi:hypothetical protein